jgi:Integrase zinc binding domain
VPKSKRLEVLKEGHDTVTTGYPKRGKMYKVLRQDFYWSEIERNRKIYIDMWELSKE